MTGWIVQRRRGFRGVVTGTDGSQFGFGGDEPGEVRGLVRSAVVAGDDHRGDLAGRVVSAVIEQAMAK